MYTVALCDWDSNIAQIAKEIGLSPFDRVILCVEDRHVRYRQENVREAIALLQDENLIVEVNGWGFEGFAGESISKTVFDWIKFLQFANSLPISTIMVDEPSSNQSLSDICTLLNEYAPNKKFHLATEPENYEVMSNELKNFWSEISLSMYLFGEASFSLKRVEEKFEYWTKHVLPLSDPDNRIEKISVWVQTWDVPEAKEWVVAHLIGQWKYYELDVNIWAWDAFRTVSSKRSKNPDLIWQKVITELKRK